MLNYFLFILSYILFIYALNTLNKYNNAFENMHDYVIFHPLFVNEKSQKFLENFKNLKERSQIKLAIFSSFI